MLAFAIYLLKVVICSGILLVYYWLMLRNKIFHQYNRFYLLAAVVLSLALPLIQIDIFHNGNEPAPQAMKLIQAVSSSDEYLDEIIVSAKQNDLSIEQTLSFVYLLTSVVFLLFFLQALIRIRSLFIKHRHRLVENIYLVNTTAKGTPFSFMRYIFWNDHIDPETPTGSQVFRHELAHVQQKHSYDKIFLNLVLILFWCNPFFWLIRKELNMIHEFVADRIAVEDSDTEAFAAMILQAAYPQHRFQLSNPFFYSPIKRRLMMLSKNRNPKVGYIGRLLVLPLTLFIFAAFTLKARNYQGNDNAYNGKRITVVIDAGHGGTDPGGTNSSLGIVEKDLNLALSKKVKALNLNNKITIVLTRESDIYHSPMEKVAIAKSLNPDLFISIHADANTLDRQSGLKVFIAKSDNKNYINSQVLASALINEFNTRFELPVQQHPKQQQTNIRVLEESICPAVLIETGNISNDKDVDYLRSAVAQDVIAGKILAAVEKYAVALEKNKSGISAPVVAVKETTIVNTKDTVPAATKSNEKNQLIVVDGKIVTKDILEKIVPERIESIQVVNNWEAASIYGEQAKNGVIIVTTKPTEVTLRNVRVNIENDSSKMEEVNVSTANISIRGEANPGNQPLYIVNEKIIGNNINLDNINANNIESITILKDKTAVNKYGRKAINGAVEITTKDNKAISEVVVAGGTNINYSMNEVVVVGSSTNSNKHVDVDDKVFTLAENAAHFPGGDSAWRKYLLRNLKASIPIQEGWKAGVYKIIVSFIVRKDGSIADIRTNDYPGSKTSEHCIELIRNGPKWIPAQQNGLAVNAYKKQPITFVVSDKAGL